MKVRSEIGSEFWDIPLANEENGLFSLATPSATTTITMIQVAGYRFKDYFRFGGLIGIIGLIVTWVCLVLFYGLI